MGILEGEYHEAAHEHAVSHPKQQLHRDYHRPAEKRADGSHQKENHSPSTGPYQQHGANLMCGVAQNQNALIQRHGQKGLPPNVAVFRRDLPVDMGGKELHP